MADKLRVGLIGYKFMGRAHTNAWSQAPRFFDLPMDVECSVVCGRDEQAVGEFAKEWGWAEAETDWRKVVAKLLGPLPPGKRVFYQKHMAHHLLPEIDRAWLDRAVNVFLIREPEAMLTSLIKKIPEPGVEDTGLPQQVELFNRVRERSDKTPPVLDSRDVLLDPRGMLSALCAAAEIPFDDAMLSWPAGKRDSDGIWAKYWYAEVEKSTGFQPYREKDERVPDRLRGVLDACREHYAVLHAARLQV